MPVEEAFAGFGNEATIIVALVLVVSRGFVNSGTVDIITRQVSGAGRGLGTHIAMMGGISSVLSAFMNNVAALALLMPVDMQAAHKAGRRGPGLTLMPLAFATILGGMVTLIGTPPPTSSSRRSARARSMPPSACSISRPWGSSVRASACCSSPSSAGGAARPRAHRRR
ncbi:SLC13 family permease [Breoghania sp.]|uniref:SLC13 family permease n=1 Tax=Breoghania sp. TaxID=2065378 RepID=UPI0032048D82